jgi:ElaB/YqjD/DUF883 family membrane-anchored ribosome-binding protein
MSNSPTNRLHPLWSSESADGNESALPDFKRLAAKLEPAIENVGATIAEHPRVSLTLAATLGVLAGWFIKRR